MGFKLEFLLLMLLRFKHIKLPAVVQIGISVTKYKPSKLGGHENIMFLFDLQPRKTGLTLNAKNHFSKN
jgi:hypothetical protein